MKKSLFTGQVSPLLVYRNADEEDFCIFITWEEEPSLHFGWYKKDGEYLRKLEEVCVVNPDVNLIQGIAEAMEYAKKAFEDHKDDELLKGL